MGTKWTLVAALLAGLCAVPASAKTIALVVGVGAYPHRADRLDGPPFDVAAVRSLLVDKMGVAPGDIRSLIDAQATRDGIRKELSALMGRSAPGDTVVLYFSGHGTSGRDTENASIDLPYGTGAFVPYDVRENPAPKMRDRLIVGRFDLGPLALTPLDEAGRKVIVLVDACYSGNAVRGLREEAHYRYMPIGGGEDDLAAGAETAESDNSPPPPYPYRNVVMLSASAETEKARDLGVNDGTASGNPHGAFTDALLRAFSGDIETDFNGDGQVSFEELKRAEVAYMAQRGISQTPQLLPSIGDDKSGLIFGAVPGLAPSHGSGASASASFSVDLGPGTEVLGPALRQLGGLVFENRNADLTVRRNGAAYRIANAAGDVVADGASPDVVTARIRAGQWLKGAVAAARAKIDIRADTVPTAKGGTFVIGRDSLKIAATANQSAVIMIIDLWADGTLATLYPIAPEEMQPLPAKSQVVVPNGAPIEATPPAGLDRVLVLAFPQAPAGMDRWARLRSPFSGAQAQAFVAWLRDQQGGYAAATIDVRVVEAGQ